MSGHAVQINSSHVEVSTPVLGYKIFKSDWTCINFQYPFGNKHTSIDAPMTVVHEGPVIMCESGFHFCQQALDCLRYY
jgi:hypothetical protein